MGSMLGGCWRSGSMSLRTVIMNPDRAKDLSNMMNELDQWDAQI